MSHPAPPPGSNRVVVDADEIGELANASVALLLFEGSHRKAKMLLLLLPSRLSCVSPTMMVINDGGGNVDDDDVVIFALRLSRVFLAMMMFVILTST